MPPPVVAQTRLFAQPVVQLSRSGLARTFAIADLDEVSSRLPFIDKASQEYCAVKYIFLVNIDKHLGSSPILEVNHMNASRYISVVIAVLIVLLGPHALVNFAPQLQLREMQGLALAAYGLGHSLGLFTSESYRQWPGYPYTYGLNGMIMFLSFVWIIRTAFFITSSHGTTILATALAASSLPLLVGFLLSRFVIHRETAKS